MYCNVLRPWWGRLKNQAMLRLQRKRRSNKKKKIIKHPMSRRDEKAVNKTRCRNFCPARKISSSPGNAGCSRAEDPRHTKLDFYSVRASSVPWALSGILGPKRAEKNGPVKPGLACYAWRLMGNCAARPALLIRDHTPCQVCQRVERTSAGMPPSFMNGDGGILALETVCTCRPHYYRSVGIFGVILGPWCRPGDGLVRPVRLGPQVGSRVL